MPQKQGTIDFPVHKTRSYLNKQRKAYKFRNSQKNVSDGTLTKSVSDIFPNLENLHSLDNQIENNVPPNKKQRSDCYSSENLKSHRKIINDAGILYKENIDKNSPSVSPLKTPPTPFERSPLKNLPLSNVDNNRSPKQLSSFSSPRNQNKILSTPVRRSPRKLNFSTINNESPKETLNCPEETVVNIKEVYKSLKCSFASCSTRLVGREEQLEKLERYLKQHLESCSPGSLYISGAPGTGKTASVIKTVEELKLQMPKLNTLLLNCMSKKSSKTIFSEINNSFSSKKGARSEKDLIANIARHITSSKNPLLLILDEIDQLESKNQSVLYTIFEWPSLVGSKLVLIGIANMLDLTDRILPRLQSNKSFKPELLHFSSYSKMEIVNIIQERIKEANVTAVEVIKQSAIHFLAGKVAAVAGDVRKALDVCRRAVELTELEIMRPPTFDGDVPSMKKIKQVDIPQILAIFNEIYGCQVTNLIVDNGNTFPLQQKLLLCSLLLIIKYSKSKDVTFGKLHEIYCRVCQRQKLPLIEQSEFASICGLLETRGLLQIKNGKELRASKIILRLDEEDAIRVLGDRALLASILRDKSSVMKLN